MAKKDKDIEETEEVIAVVTAVPKTEREVAWEAFKERLKTQSPAKYEIRLKAGELNKIPDSFTR